MLNRLNPRGQTLVEMAFLFPIIILVFLLFAQVLRLIITAVTVHKSAMAMAYDVASGRNSTSSLALSILSDETSLRHTAFFNPLSTSIKQDEALESWKPYKGVGTFKEPPHLVRTRYAFRLFSGTWYGWTLPGNPLQAMSECPQDIDIRSAE